MSYHDDSHDPIGRGVLPEYKQRNKRSKLLKGVLIAGTVIVVLFIALVVFAIVLAINAASFTISGVQQAIVEIWQTVNGWFQPITDLYDRAVKLAPGQE
jgi:hypothetical protein